MGSCRWQPDGCHKVRDRARWYRDRSSCPRQGFLSFMETNLVETISRESFLELDNVVHPSGLGDLVLESTSNGLKGWSWEKRETERQKASETERQRETERSRDWETESQRGWHGHTLAEWLVTSVRAEAISARRTGSMQNSAFGSSSLTVPGLWALAWASWKFI